MAAKTVAAKVARRTEPAELQAMPSAVIEEIAVGIGQMQGSLAEVGVHLGDYFGSRGTARPEALEALIVAWGAFLTYAAGWLDSDIGGDEAVWRRLFERWTSARLYGRAHLDDDPPLRATVAAMDAEDEAVK
jgi:hypothetical protein